MLEVVTLLTAPQRQPYIGTRTGHWPAGPVDLTKSTIVIWPFALNESLKVSVIVSIE